MISKGVLSCFGCCGRHTSTHAALDDPAYLAARYQIRPVSTARRRAPHKYFDRLMWVAVMYDDSGWASYLTRSTTGLGILRQKGDSSTQRSTSAKFLRLLHAPERFVRLPSLAEPLQEPAWRELARGARGPARWPRVLLHERVAEPLLHLHKRRRGGGGVHLTGSRGGSVVIVVSSDAHRIGRRAGGLPRCAPPEQREEAVVPHGEDAAPSAAVEAPVSAVAPRDEV
eukprot:2616583-Pleurochrysis_carterae.AAC.1